MRKFLPTLFASMLLLSPLVSLAQQGLVTDNGDGTYTAIYTAGKAAGEAKISVITSNGKFATAAITLLDTKVELSAERTELPATFLSTTNIILGVTDNNINQGNNMHLLSCVIATCVILGSVATRGYLFSRDSVSPFQDAVVSWHMNGLNSSEGDESQLTVQGNVKLGVDLLDTERSDSMQRLGDGQVAVFDGGYLLAGEGAEQALDLRGDKMSLCFRFRNTSGCADAPLLSRNVPNDQHSNLLYTTPLNMNLVRYPYLDRTRDENELEFRWRTTPLKERVRAEYFDDKNPIHRVHSFHIDWEKKHGIRGDFLDGILRLNAPIGLIGKDRWHDVIVRFNRAKLELFVDGVLIDENWPHGNLHQFQGPFLIGAGFQDGKLLSGFRGLVDHVAIWDRALSDEEISRLSGGPDVAAQRDIEIFGTKQKVGQYWNPRGFNTSVGDCMAFSHDGTFHVYFLSNRRYGGSKWGLQALPWGHVSTKDLRHWKEHPCPLDITEPWECCLGTGSFAYHDRKFHLYFIKHDRRAPFLDNPNYGDAVFTATSDNGLLFEKEFSPLFVPGFFNTNDINPDIYPDKTNGGYILNLSNWKVFQSKDLKQWEVRENITTPEWWVCSSYFQWNDWYYYSSCGFYWMSQEPVEDPAAEWEWASQQTINDGIRVPKMDQINGRYISAGFTPTPPDAYYGGELLVRELIQEPDGLLGSKWVEEMIPESGDLMKLVFSTLRGNAWQQGGAILISAPEGFAIGALENVPQDVRITLQVKPRAGTKQFGISVRGTGNYESGCELQFAPDRSHVQFAAVTDSRIAEVESNWIAIPGVRDIDKPFTLDLIVKDDLIDACIGNRRTIITRNLTKLTGDQLFFFVQDGKATFDEIRVRPLIENTMDA